MKINVRYFASVREALGTGSEAVETDAPTLGALRDELIARGEPHASALARGRAVRMALDQVMSDESAAAARRQRGRVLPAGHRRLSAAWISQQALAQRSPDARVIGERNSSLHQALRAASTAFSGPGIGVRRTSASISGSSGCHCARASASRPSRSSRSTLHEALGLQVRAGGDGAGAAFGHRAEDLRVLARQHLQAAVGDQRAGLGQCRRRSP